jgi:TP901 family phage tail tape measure protein
MQFGSIDITGFQGVKNVQDKLIGQIRLDLSRLKQDIENINKQLKGINGGKQNVDLGISLGNGMTQVIQEIDKFNKKGEYTHTVIKKIKDGLLEVYKTKEKGGKETLISQETLNSSKAFQSVFNTIINSYKKLEIEQRKLPENINKTIEKLNLLRNAYKIDSNEFKNITTQINLLENKRSSYLSAEAKKIESQNKLAAKEAAKNIPMTMNDYVNQGFLRTLHQLQTQIISSKQFVDKMSNLRNSDSFNSLTRTNQVRLVQELTRAESEHTRVLRESESIKSKIKAIQDYKGIQSEINNYRQLSVEQQKTPANIQKIINEYNKLIEKYKQEGREVSKLISQRDKYNKTLSQSINQTLNEYDRKNNIALTNGVMGSGDRRATIPDKVANSIIYSTSAMAYGSALMSINNLIKANKEFETGLINISRTMNNVTQKDIKEMGDASIELGRKYGRSVNDVQSAMTELARAGIDDKKTLKEMSESVLVGLNTTEIKDANQMVGYLVSTVKQMGLQFSDTNKIIDEWNYLADKYAVKSDDFAQAIQKSGSAAKNVGISLQELNAMTVVLGERTGKSGTEIGTAFQSLFTKMYRPEALKTLKQYGITVNENNVTFKGFQDVMAQVDRKLESFGERSVEANDILDALGATMRKNDISILAKNWSGVDSIVSEQSKALGYSAKENEKIMGTLEAQINQLKVAFTELAVSIGQSGLLAELKAVFAGIKLVVDGFNSLPSWAKQFLLILGQVAIVMKVVSIATKTAFNTSLTQIIMSAALKLGIYKNTLSATSVSIKATAAAERLLTAQVDSGIISFTAKEAIMKRLSVQNKVLTAEEKAYKAALDATNVASKGARIAAGAASLGITIAIGMAIQGIMWLIGEADRRKDEINNSIQEFEASKSKVEGLSESFLKNKFTIQDNDTAKQNYIATEKTLQEILGKTNKTIDIQNKSLKEQIALFDEAAVSAAEKFKSENTSKYESAKEVLNQIGNTIIQTTDIGEIIKLDGFKDIIEKYTTDMGNIGYVIDGTLQYRYETLGKLLKELTDRYNSYSEEGKKAHGELLFAITSTEKEYSKLKDIAEINIKMVKDYEEALKTLANAKFGDEFKIKFSKDLDFIDEKIKNMSNLKPSELPKAYDELISMRKKMEATMNPEELLNYKPVMDKIFNGISEGAKVATKGIDDLTISNKELEESMSQLENSTKILGSAYKELSDNGNLNINTAIELLNKYPQLAAQMRIQNGVITLNKEGLNSLWQLEKDKLVDTLKNKQLEIKAYLKDTEIKLRANAQQGKSLVELMDIESTRVKKSIEENKKMADAYRAIPFMGNEIALAIDMATNFDNYSWVNGIDEARNKAEQLEAISKQIEILQDPSTNLNNYSGYESKKASSGSQKQEIGESVALIEKERYFALNNELERTNTLLSKNKALQENSLNKERVNLLNQEIVLLKKKQDGLHNIAQENRIEREELRKELLTKGFDFKGIGDNLEITNAKAILDSKLNQVNAVRNDKEKENYNRLKSEYDDMKKSLDRFIEIQNKSIPDMQQQWWGLSKEINEANKSIIELKVNLQFEPINKANEAFNNALSNLQYEEKINGKDIIKQQELKNKIIELYTNNIMRNSSELDVLNAETDKAKLADENYIKQKNDLINLIKEQSGALYDLTNEIENNRQQSVDNTEQRIIDIITKGVELRKKALDKELSDYKEHVDKIVSEREREYATEDYNKDIQKMLKERQKLQDKINKLSLDTSIEGYQKRKDLEAKLAEIDEQISEKKTGRQRDLLKQNFELETKQLEEKNKKENEKLDKDFSEANKKVMAHDILISKSFDSIKNEFPELFKELNIETVKFFDVFKEYEIKFGSIIGDVAKKFTDTILPEIKKAVQDIIEIENQAKTIGSKAYNSDFIGPLPNGSYVTSPFDNRGTYLDNTKLQSDAAINKAMNSITNSDSYKNTISKYTKKYYESISFDPNRDYQSEIDNLLKSGKTENDADVIKLIEARAAKIYSKPELTTKYGHTIPEKYKIIGSYSQGINKGLVDKTGLYMLHGSKTRPEWILNNDQMFNFVKGLANNLTSYAPNNNNGSNLNDINLNINIMGNADNSTVNDIKNAGKSVITDLKKELNKIGIYK